MTTRLEPLPDIEAFGLSWSLPLEWVTGSASPFRPAGTPMPSSPEEFVQSRLQVTSPGYFEAMGFRLRAGRTFTRLDGPESPRVLVANETLARGLFGGEPAVGRRVLIADRDEPWEVIGVVEDIVYEGLELTAEPRAEAFFSMAQTGGGRYFGFRTRIYATIRTAGDPLAAIPFLREAATAANPQATLGPVMTMEARLSDAVAQPRFYAVFVGSFAGLALLLVAFGIYGLLSYTVAQRQGEIGSRAGEPSVRRRHRRPADVHHGTPRGRGGRACRLLVPGAEGGPRRSNEDATLRIACLLCGAGSTTWGGTCGILSAAWEGVRVLRPRWSSCSQWASAPTRRCSASSTGC